MKYSILAIVCLISIHSHALEFVSQPKQTTLLELYSSEGCSSCPPAEKQLSSLRTNNRLWKDFVPVNFHVDYWNNLGWVDPYSNSQFTLRQRQYASLWKTRTVYTPAFVENAKSVGSSLPTIALNEKSAVPSLKIKVNEKREAVAEIGGLDAAKEYEIHFVLLGNGLVSKITSGENSGRTLEQNFVVLDLKTEAILKGHAQATLQVKGTKVQPKTFAFAAWVTERGSLTPLQTVGGNLPN